MKISEAAQPLRFVCCKDRQSLPTAFQKAGAALIWTFGLGVIAATAAMIGCLLMLGLMTMRLLAVSLGHAFARRCNFIARAA
jgi:hypothetical protein